MADVDAIKFLNGVMGTQWSGEQFQIIIGQKVPDLYALVRKKGGLENLDSSAESMDNKPKEPLTPNSEWIMMTGKEFYRFIKSPEGKSRYFIMWDDLVIETSREQCSDWLSEQEHCEYLFVLVLGAVFLIVPS